jgi:hypothetical protein
MTYVAQAEHADHTNATVDDRQPAEVQLLHVPYRLSKVIVLPAAMDPGGHHFTRRSTSGIEAVIGQAFADVTLSEISPDRALGRSIYLLGDVDSR